MRVMIPPAVLDSIKVTPDDSFDISAESGNYDQGFMPVNQGRCGCQDDVPYKWLSKLTCIPNLMCTPDIQLIIVELFH